MHSYCSECGESITNALGECCNCINEAQRDQEPWECDESPDDHPDYDIDYDEWVGDYE